MSASVSTVDTMSMTVGFVGAGNFTRALIIGWTSAGILNAEQIWASGPKETSIAGVKNLGVHTTTSNKECVKDKKVIILSVKPHILPSVLEDIRSVVTRDQLVMSVATGVQLVTIEQRLPDCTRIVRIATAGTTCSVRQAASVFSVGKWATSEDVALVKTLMSGVGICEECKESLVSAVSALTAPGHMLLASEAMADGGVLVGLPRRLAQTLAAQTMIGIGKLILEMNKHPGVLKDEIASPGGVTIAMIESLEKAGFRGAIIDSIAEGHKQSLRLAEQASVNNC